MNTTKYTSDVDLGTLLRRQRMRFYAMWWRNGGGEVALRIALQLRDASIGRRLIQS